MDGHAVPPSGSDRSLRPPGPPSTVLRAADARHWSGALDQTAVAGRSADEDGHRSGLLPALLVEREELPVGCEHRVGAVPGEGEVERTTDPHVAGPVLVEVDRREARAGGIGDRQDREVVGQLLVVLQPLPGVGVVPPGDRRVAGGGSPTRRPARVDLLTTVAAVMRHRLGVTNWLTACFRTLQQVGRHTSRAGTAVTDELPQGEVLASIASDGPRLADAFDVTQRAVASLAASTLAATALPWWAASLYVGVGELNLIVMGFRGGRR